MVSVLSRTALDGLRIVYESVNMVPVLSRHQHGLRIVLDSAKSMKVSILSRIATLDGFSIVYESAKMVLVLSRCYHGLRIALDSAK